MASGFTQCRNLATASTCLRKAATDISLRLQSREEPMVNVGRAQGNKQQVLFKGIMSSYLHFDSEEEALHENNPVQNSTLSDFTIVICKLKKEKALQRKTFSLRIFKPYFLLC